MNFVVASRVAMALLLLGAAVRAAAAAIDRRAVVGRHDVRFAHDVVDAAATALDVLTVGNGEIGFGADLTGLQSLNTSYHTPSYPLYTMSNWGWHSPDPVALGANSSGFNADGTLAYTYENVSIASADTRPGKGNRTVPYQFNCKRYNDPALCSYYYTFPARVNLGQLAFVLPERGPAPLGPYAGCSGVGVWCNTGAVSRDAADGKFYCKAGRNITVAPANTAAGNGAAQPAIAACNETASTEHGWKNAPFCLEANGQIQMTGVTSGKTNFGYFDGSCDLIQWNNTFDSSKWCRAGSDACAPGLGSGSAGNPAGGFKFLDPRDLSAASQSLDMYTGVLSSNWSVNGSAVRVLTVVDSDTDTVSTKYTRPADLDLAVQLAFCSVSKKGQACAWNPDDGFPHKTTVVANASGRLDLFRESGADTYSVSCSYSSGTMRQTGPHAFALSGTSPAVELSCRYALNCCVGPRPPLPRGALSGQPVPSFAESAAHAAGSWAAFWEEGAMVDISGATADPRAFELERRVVQSAYLLRSQESGSVMPQESGLLYNSWTGKHHSEMRYWHQTWLPLWGHPGLLAKSDQWFLDRLANATSNTAMQGYKGARWGKMLGESNMFGHGKGPKAIMYWESPNQINPGLVWHQPHVIYMAELEYRAARAKSQAAADEVLHRLKDVVLSTAAFVGDFPERRNGTGTDGAYLDLGPPLVSASEGEGPYDVWNPTYEITQFNFSLDLANQWRERLGMERNKEWDYVRANLAPPPIVAAPNGKSVYNRHQNCLPSVFAEHPQHCSGHRSHPALTGALGCLPGDRYGIDRDVMNNTLHETLSVWSWEHCWGWDQPMVAMTATRLEQPQVAVDTLLMNSTTNVYIATGYNHPRASGGISAYLPGNGGILIAVGLMAGGWENGPQGEAPGFPAEWGVKAEGFIPYF